MRSWPLYIAFLYGFILVFLFLPVLLISFYPEGYLWLDTFYKAWFFWVWVAAMIAGQWIFLRIPVFLGSERPITKKSITATVISASCMCSLLVVGMAVSIGETITADGVNTLVWRIALGVFVSSWIVWGIIFSLMAKRLDPKNVIERLSHKLLKGSILELLVAIPTHVIARHKDYCCAGYSTFIGIVFGLSVMLFAFGPGVVFLYIKRYNDRKGRN